MILYHGSGPILVPSKNFYSFRDHFVELNSGCVWAWPLELEVLLQWPFWRRWLLRNIVAPSPIQRTLPLCFLAASFERFVKYPDIVGETCERLFVLILVLTKSGSMYWFSELASTPKPLKSCRLWKISPSSRLGEVWTAIGLLLLMPDMKVWILTGHRFFA